MKPGLTFFLQGLLLSIAERYDLAFSPRPRSISTIDYDLFRSVHFGVRTFPADVDAEGPDLFETFWEDCPVSMTRYSAKEVAWWSRRLHA